MKARDLARALVSSSVLLVVTIGLFLISAASEAREEGGFRVWTYAGPIAASFVLIVAWRFWKEGSWKEIAKESRESAMGEPSPSLLEIFVFPVAIITTFLISRVRRSVLFVRRESSWRGKVWLDRVP